MLPWRELPGYHKRRTAMSKQVLTTLDFNAQGKIIGLPNGIDPQDAATVAQLTAAIEGMAWKDDVVCRAASNINLASPGATIDGVTMTANDRFLASEQTADADNGIYIYNGASTPATRSLDMNASIEFNQAIVPVGQGTSAGTQWRQTALNPTVGSTTITFVAFLAASPAASESTAGIAEIATQAETDAGTDDARIVTPLKLKTASFMLKKYSTLIGDGTATSFTVTHNLGSRDVQVSVYRVSGSYDEVEVDVDNTTTNTVTIVFNVAPASNAFRVVVIG
jgi:hypothetical protein